MALPWSSGAVQLTEAALSLGVADTGLGAEGLPATVMTLDDPDWPLETRAGSVWASTVA